MEKIKLLRAKTGAGMVACKKALDESDGDIDKAVEILRKLGIAKAAKRGERETSEGVIKVAVNDSNDEAYILEVNSETDFVSKNEKFQALADSIMKVIIDNKPSNLEELMGISMETGTVQEVVDNFSGTIGEKLVVKNFEILNASGASASAYSHAGGRIGAIVAFDKKIDLDLARDIAMQVAASAPTYINPEDVPTEVTDKEKEVYTEQLKKEGKPEQIIEKILVGKIDKYYTEVCLMKQEYIKDDKQSVENILGDARVLKFVRYSL